MFRLVSLTTYAVMAAFFIVQPVFAHGDEDHKKPEKKEHEHKMEHKAVGEEHSHKAPHGGMVITVEKYHLEMVVKPDGAQIYLLDDKEKTLPISKVTGSVIFQIPGKKITTAKLAAKEDYLNALVDLKQVDEFVAIVSLKVDGKNQTGRFAYRKMDHHKEMKPEDKHEDHGSGGHHH